MLQLTVQNKNGEVMASAEAEDRCALVYDKAYEEGDTISMRTSETDVYLVLQLDDALGQAFVYQKTPELKFIIPFEEKRISYSPKAFYGEKHVITVRRATEAEIDMHKNLACNVYDQHGDTGCFPHAHANVETRGEAVLLHVMQLTVIAAMQVTVHGRTNRGELICRMMLKSLLNSAERLKLTVWFS